MKTLRNTWLALILISLMPFVQAGELSNKDVEKWLKAMPGLTGWLAQHEDKLGADDVMAQSNSMDQVFAKGVEQLRAKGLYKDFNSQVNKQGYKNVEQWANTSRDITMAYMAIEMEQEQVSISQMEAQLQQLKAAEGIPAEQKVMMEQMMKASLMMVQAAKKVPTKNKEAVRPYLKQIRKSLDEQNADPHQH